MECIFPYESKERLKRRSSFLPTSFPIPQMKRLFLLVLIVVFAGFSMAYGQPSSQLIYLDQGELVYAPFAMTGQSNQVNTIPDFSHAGYMGGGVALPEDIPVKVTIIPEEGDDTRRIQEAIDLVEALDPDARGFRGVVLIKAGHYSLENILVVRESGVVLKGEGQGLNGTVLHANPRLNHTVISILGDGGISKDASSEQIITTGFVPVGAYSFEINDAADYQVGDNIVVTRTPNKAWIDTLGMGFQSLCEGKSGCVGWSADSYVIDHERVITSISGNVITIDIPIVDVIETGFGGGTVSRVQSSKRITQCGVENLRIQSFYENNSDESHAWTAIRLKYAENCWVKGVTGQYLAYSTVNLEDANFTTVEDCAYLDPKSVVTGGRRYSFAIQEGIGNLFQRCYAKNGRHDFVTGSRVTGPNVFLDGIAESAQSDIGPHHRWATGTLFDNLKGGSTRVWNRGNSGTGHGWSGAQTMFWNIDSYSGEFRVDSPEGGMNWGIGCVGSSQTGAGYWESWGTAVQPRSLYIQQLEDRSGLEAVENVVIPEQQSGAIFELLSNWRGEGDIVDGGITGEIPTVSFLNPPSLIDVSTWQGGVIEVNATDDDGSIQHVKVLINGELAGIDMEAPYTFSNLTTVIRSLSHEIHFLQAIATDDDGNTAITRLAILGGDPPEPEEEEGEENLIIRIFPNPVENGELTIEMKESGTYTVRILDLQGREVDQWMFEGLEIEHILTQSLGEGLYILEIKEEGELLFMDKLVIR